MKSILINPIFILLVMTCCLIPVKATSENIPNFIGENGFVVLGELNDDLYCDKSFDKYKEFPKNPWSICAVKQTGPYSWKNDISIKIIHKTPVKVINQNLKISTNRWNRYIGTLEVEDVKKGNIYTIDYKNYSKTAFWKNKKIQEAMEHGHLIAKFSGNDSPIDESGEFVKVEKGSLVLVVGKTGLYPNIDSDTYSITAFTYKNWKYGYGGVALFYKVCGSANIIRQSHQPKE